MTLLVPMYHHASGGPFGNTAETLDAHFAWIASHCHCALPGEPLDDERLNVCPTFDDAYVDFYAVVYPLLRRHGLRSVLAVPTAAIRERTLLAMADRLRACATRSTRLDADGGHCTWTELLEMAASGSVTLAAHGHHHVRLDRPEADLDGEIAQPKALLSARLGRAVDSYVLPFGRFDAAALACARQHYRFVFRIGGADNAGWSGKLLYRIDADAMAAPQALFGAGRRVAYRWRRYWNESRGR